MENSLHHIIIFLDNKLFKDILINENFFELPTVDLEYTSILFKIAIHNDIYGDGNFKKINIYK